MNKKGFTLVELMATIAILVLMSVVIGVNITSILRSTEDYQESFDKTQIEKAACVYVDSDELCPKKNCYGNVKISVLINNGLLESETYDSIKDKTVNVTKGEDGLKKCTYN